MTTGSAELTLTVDNSKGEAAEIRTFLVSDLQTLIPPHAPTTAIPDAETRQKMADEGQVIIEKLVERLNLPHVVEQLRKLEEYGLENEKKYPWMPSAWNKNH